MRKIFSTFYFTKPLILSALVTFLFGITVFPEGQQLLAQCTFSGTIDGGAVIATNVGDGGTITVCETDIATDDFIIMVENAGASGNFSGDLGAAALTNTFTVSSGTNSGSYNISYEGVVSGGGCNMGDMVSFTLNIDPPPTNPPTGMNFDMCVGDDAEIITQAAIMSGNMTVSPNYTIVGFNAGTTGATLNGTTIENPMSTGDITFMVAENNACGNSPVSELITTTVIALPTITAVETEDVCQDNLTTVTLTGLPTMATLTVSYTIDGNSEPDEIVTSDMDGTATFDTRVLVPADNGDELEITMIVDNGTACSATPGATTNLMVQRNPNIQAIANQTVCANTTGVDIAATSNNPTRNSSVVWSANNGGGTVGTFDPSSDDTNPYETTYTPSEDDIAAGTVTITATAFGVGPCILETRVRTMTLTIDPMPEADAGDDASICEADGAFTVSTATADFNTTGTILWTHDGTGTLTNETTLTPTYTPAANETGDVTLTMEITDTGGGPCNGEMDMDEMVLSIDPAPEADAGTSEAMCSSDTNFDLTNSATQPSFANGTIAWTSTGTGLFSNPNVLLPSYTPSAADITAGTVDLTITVTGLGECSDEDAMSTMTLTIDAAPEADAGSDDAICSDETHTLSTASAANGDIVWTSSGDGSFDNDAIAQPVYTPGLTDIMNGTVDLTITVTNNVGPANGCNGEVASDVMTLDIDAAPEADAGSDATICGDGTSYDLSTSSPNAPSAANGDIVWTSNGDGDFDDDAIAQPVYMPGPNDITNGTVDLTITVTNNDINSACNGTAVMGTMTLTLDAAPMANAGSDETLCDVNAAFDLSTSSTVPSSLNGSVEWTTSGNGAFDDPNIDAPVYTPNQEDIDAGMVTLTMTVTSNAVNGDACFEVTDIDMMVLTFLDSPTADAGDDASICSDETHTLSTASATNGTIVWSSSGDGGFDNTAIAQPVYTPGPNDITNGTATLTITVTGMGDCSSEVATDDMELTIGSAPTVAVDAADAICGTDGTYDLADGNPAAANGDIQWTTSGTGTFDDETALEPVYTPSAADITNMGTNGGEVTLTITVTGTDGACSGEEVSAELDLTIDPAPAAHAGSDASICENETLDLSMSTVDPSSANGTILWTTNGDGTFDDDTEEEPVYTPGAADIAGGTVILTLTVTGNVGECTGEMASNSMILKIDKLPTAVDASDETVCSADSPIDLSTITTPPDAENGTVLWTADNGGGAGVDVGAFSDDTEEQPTYTLSQADIDAGSVTLTMTVTAAGACEGEAAATDDIVLTIDRAPMAEAGESATICGDGSSFTLADAEAPAGTTIAWTADNGGGVGVNTGVYDNPSLQNPVYTPSAEDIAAGSVMLTMTVSGNGECNDEDDATETITLSFDPRPTVTAGSDATICADGSLDLSSTDTPPTSENGTVMWSGGDGVFDDATVLTPTYTPGATDIANGTVDLTITITGLGACSDIMLSDLMTLSIDPLPTANAGSDETICGADNEIDLSLSTMPPSATNGTILWTSNGTGAFIDATVAQPTYVLSEADVANEAVELTMTVTGTVGECNGKIATDMMTVTVEPGPEANAGSFEAACETDESFDLSTSSIPPTAANGTIVWTTSSDGTFDDNTVEAPVYNLGASDVGGTTVTLTLTVTGDDGECFGEIAEDFIQLVIDDAPTVGVDPTVTICGDGSDVNLGTLNPMAMNGDILWTSDGTGTFDDDESLTPVYTPSEDDITNGSVTLTITVTGTDGACTGETVEASVDVTIDPAPVATVDATAAICSSETSFDLNEVSPAGENGDIVWTTNGDGGFNDANTATPVYTPGPNDYTNGTVTLTITVTNNEVAAACNGVSDMASVVLTIDDAPTADAGSDEIICSSEGSLDLSTSTVPPTAANGTIEWTTSGDGTFDDDAAVSPVYTPGANDISSGTVTLTISVTGLGGCSDAAFTAMDNMNLAIDDAPVANAGSDENVCAGDDLDLSTSMIIPSANGTVQWTTSGDGGFDDDTAVTPIYTPSANDIAAGTVTLTMEVTGTAVCTGASGTDMDDMVLTISENPDVSITPFGASTSFCASNNLVLSATIGFTAEATDQTFNWSVLMADPGVMNTGFSAPTAQTTEFTAMGEGMVTVELIYTDGNGCFEKETIILTVEPQPDENAIIGDQSVCPDALETYMVTTDNSDVPTNATYNWSLASGGSIVGSNTSPLVQIDWIGIPSGPYTLSVVETVNGCSTTNTYLVTIEDTESPVITTCPPARDVPLDENCQITVPDLTGEVVATDNCTDAFDLSITQDPMAGTVMSMIDGQTLNVSITVTDEQSNEDVDMCVVVLTAQDMTPPSLTCAPNQDVVMDENCEITIPDLVSGSSGTDNCSSVNITQDPIAGTTVSVVDGEVVEVTITGTDLSSNSSQCTVNLTAKDETAPDLTCTSNTTVSLDENCEVTIPDLVSGSNALDACSEPSTVTQSPAIGAIQAAAHGDEIMVTVTATDNAAAANSASCMVTLTVEDNIDPTVTCNHPTLELDANGLVSVSLDDVAPAGNYDDNCGVVSVAFDAGDLTDFNCSHVGTPQTVNVTVLDAANNSGTCSATITIVDNIDPEANCVPFTAVLDETGNVTINDSDVDGGSSDNCDFTLKASPSDFTCENLGANAVTLVVTDASNNLSQCQTTVTVVDNTAPTAVCATGVTVQLNENGVGSLTAEEVDGGSTDNCEVVSSSINNLSYNCDNVGSDNMVTLTVLDQGGLSATCETSVTVEDNIAPNVSCMNITVAVASDGTPTVINAEDLVEEVSDNCGIQDIIASQTSFDIDDVGEVSVGVNAVDVNNNAASCMATVNVIENQDNLPIERLDFSANLNNKVVELDWTTNIEINNKLFEVEHSADGVKFEIIGTIEGAGNSATAQSYAYTHDKPVVGLNYYRIKQVDFNGDFTYSTVEVVRFVKGSVVVYPNPTSGDINIAFSDADTKEVRIRIMLLDGREVFRTVLNMEDTATTNLQLEEVGAELPGIYLLEITSGQNAPTIVKLVKE